MFEQASQLITITKLMLMLIFLGREMENSNESRINSQRVDFRADQGFLTLRKQSCEQR